MWLSSIENSSDMCIHACQVVGSGAAHLDVVGGIISWMVGEAAVNVGENGGDSERRRNDGGVIFDGEWCVFNVIVI